MFKFSKIVVLLLLVFSLAACSSVPTGVDKDFFNNNKEMVLVIDKCYNDNANCKLDNVYDDFLAFIDTWDWNNANESSIEIRDAVFSLIFVYLSGSDEYEGRFNKASELLNLNKKY